MINYLEVKLDVHVFPKTARIVIAQSFSISKGLKQRQMRERDQGNDHDQYKQ